MKAVLEKVPAQLQRSFYSSDYRKPRFDSPWHYHPEWELTYIEQGQGMAYVGNTIHPFKAGELVLLGPLLPHCWKSERCERGVISHFAQVDDKLLGANWLDKPEFLDIKKLLKESRNGLLFSEATSLRLGPELAKLHQQAPAKSLMGLLTILFELSQATRKRLSDYEHIEIKDSACDRIDRIIKYVEDNYQNEISSTELCQLSAMSNTSFAKFFRKTFNKTFTRYLNEYRISRACILLGNSQQSIESVAFDVGYRNMSFFHRQFKNICGLTPANYRRDFQSL